VSDPSAEPPERRDEPDTRRPASLYGSGVEPDVRFSMANERTALAWMRTALAVVAAGVGLTSIVRLADLPWAVNLLAALMCLTGAALAGVAWSGWRSREEAMRNGRPLPAPAALGRLAVVVAVTAVLLAVAVVD
jgi:putative membrane protein